jgi:hypothetical protein
MVHTYQSGVNSRNSNVGGKTCASSQRGGGGWWHQLVGEGNKAVPSADNTVNTVEPSADGSNVNTAKMDGNNVSHKMTGGTRHYKSRTHKSKRRKSRRRKSRRRKSRRRKSRRRKC